MTRFLIRWAETVAYGFCLILLYVIATATRVAILGVVAVVMVTIYMMFSSYWWGVS